MKIYEFIKEVKVNGDIFYHTTCDNNYVNNSLDSNKDKAYELFRKISSGKEVSREVLEVVEIKES